MANRYWVGNDGTWNNSSTANWSATSGGAAGASAPVAGDAAYFDANSGTGTCTINSTAACTDVVFSSSTLNLSLGGNFSPSRYCYLGGCTLTLNTYTLSCQFFWTTGASASVVNFGAGSKVTVTGSGTTVINFNAAVTYVGTALYNLDYSGSAGRTINALTAQADFKIINGTGTISLTSGSNGIYRNLDFTGFAGTLSSPSASAPWYVYGDLTLASGMTMPSQTGAFIFSAISGTQKITTNGKAFDQPLTFNGSGGTFAFQDTLTQGSTRAFTITNGTVQLKAGVTNTIGALATSGTNQKALQSTSAGSQATLSQASGNANMQYLTVKDIAATGGAKFNALNNCVTQGNNSGWYFAPQLGRPLPTFAF